jgi:hypothetical protein
VCARQERQRAVFRDEVGQHCPEEPERPLDPAQLRADDLNVPGGDDAPVSIEGTNTRQPDLVLEPHREHAVDKRCNRE